MSILYHYPPSPHSGAVFADIQSANVVGYQLQDLTGKQCNSVGITFITVGEAKTFRLGDIKVEGFNYNNEILQVLSTENASTIEKYVYITPEWDEEDFDGDGAAVGWWLKNGDEGYEDDGGVRADNKVFDANQGFLGNFVKKSVKFTYSGQVISGKTELDFSGKQCNMIANFLPRNVKFGEIECTGFNYNNEILQKLSTENASTIEKYVYITPEWDEEDFDGDGAAVGWWLKNGDEGYEDDGGVRIDNEVWPSGQSFLGNFVKKSVKLTFPDPLTTPKAE